MAKSLSSIQNILVRILPCLLGYRQTVFSQVSAKPIVFLVGTKPFSLSATPLNASLDHQWRWTSHDGRHTDVAIATRKQQKWKLNEPWTKGDRFTAMSFSLSVKCVFENGGIFSFIQTSQTELILARYEVISLQSNPLLLPELSPGSDFSLSFEFSRPLDQVSCLWEREQGDPVPNTTLSFNNISHMILPNVEKHMGGNYFFIVKFNGEILITIEIPLSVKTSTYDQRVTLYRESSNSSKVDLICKSPNIYSSAAWTRNAPLDSEQRILTSHYRNGPNGRSSVLNRESFSSPAFDGRYFPLNISPLTFEDAGTYTCFFNVKFFSSFKLRTMEVSAVSTADQQVMLMCNVSGMSGTETVAWLRMEGSDRGEMVTSQTLSENTFMSSTLKLTMPSVNAYELDWACAIFTNGLLRAKASLTLSSSMTGKTLPPSASDAMDGVESASEQTVIIVALLSLLLVGVLAAALVLYVRKSRKSSAMPSPSMVDVSEHVYGNVSSQHGDSGRAHGGGPTRRDGADEVNYSSFTHGGATGTVQPQKGTDDVIYSTVNVE